VKQLKYRWLHISDLHSVCKGIRTKIMRDSLINELEYMYQQAPFTFILITGDISDKNNGYEEAKEFIHKTINVTGVNIDNVFIVPGNHDLDRKVPDNREKEIKEYWKLDILDEKEDFAIESFLPGQDDFYKAYEDILGREYPAEEVHFVHELDDNIAIIHLNTSWMCSDSENESGKLHIGLNKLYSCLNDKKLKNKPIKIAIGHHRMSDFNSVVESHLKEIFKLNGIDLYLGGHCHESSVIFDPSINAEFCSCRQARAEELDYPAGFIISDINTDNDQSSFQFYNWDRSLAKWTYDYTVSPAKHGKYYLRGEKFNRVPATKRNIIVDLKLFGIPSDYDDIVNKFNIKDYAIYRSSVQDVRPKNQEEWDACLREISNIYSQIIAGNNNYIHVFPLALIPLLVSFGYLIQNDSNNIKIYQYYENEKQWVYDERDDEIKVYSNIEKNNSSKLALMLRVSGEIKRSDIEDVLGNDYDLLDVSIETPILSKLNYNNDVFRVKSVVKSELDKLNSNYDEIHLFLAAPAGLCIEIGRIVRKNMYPHTYIYNFDRSNFPKYTRIFNLKKISSM